jgi:hypothetical protein
MVEVMEELLLGKMVLLVLLIRVAVVVVDQINLKVLVVLVVQVSSSLKCQQHKINLQYIQVQERSPHNHQL